MPQSEINNGIADDDDVLAQINNILENLSQRMYLVMHEHNSACTLHQPFHVDLGHDDQNCTGTHDRNGQHLNEIDQHCYQRMLLLLEECVDSIAELCIFAPLRRLPGTVAMKGSDTSVSDDKRILDLVMTGMDVMRLLVSSISTGRLWDHYETGNSNDNTKMQHLSLQLAWHMSFITLPKNVVANLGLVLKRIPERCYSMELGDIGVHVATSCLQIIQDCPASSAQTNGLSSVLVIVIDLIEANVLPIAAQSIQQIESDISSMSHLFNLLSLTIGFGRSSDGDVLTVLLPFTKRLCASNFHVLALELKHDLLPEADIGVTADHDKLPFTVFDAFVMGVLEVLKVFGDDDMPSQFAFARLRVRMSNHETVVSVFEQAVSSGIQPFDDMEFQDRSGMMDEAKILLALFYVTLQACDS
ncbi:hypothetical protein HDU76_013797, partial [Blyttiomyces sp. JEL0837]